jgi:hypothetical protein
MALLAFMVGLSSLLDVDYRQWSNQRLTQR